MLRNTREFRAHENVGLTCRNEAQRNSGQVKPIEDFPNIQYRTRNSQYPSEITLRSHAFFFIDPGGILPWKLASLLVIGCSFLTWFTMTGRKIASGAWGYEESARHNPDLTPIPASSAVHRTFLSRSFRGIATIYVSRLPGCPSRCPFPESGSGRPLAEYTYRTRTVAKPSS